ncbi:MAG TPA: insulinase family protein [Desulfobacterales bacterium]|nr:insulinase family protein [Desulfobacterales bacterium]
MNPTDPNNPDIRPDENLCGYSVQKIVELKEINSFFYQLEHTDTGARHVHISNADKENTFSVAFKTVPADDTGVAHILEHTVLCGSRKFSVRDPFFSMLKRSLSTFMNAFTASDWTMYPFCTQNKKDYYNLMDVYLDAAFFPRLDPLNFKQEGYRLEPEGDEPVRLVYKGIVYNEMKGAMSSPDQVMVRSLANALYPSSTYRHNSGGDPAVIPKLTYDQLVAFHRRHYHPSNSFFYTYGNLPLRGHLSYIHEKILKNFNRIDPGTEVAPQPRWSEPRTAVYRYPIGKEEDASKKCQACVAWLTADIRDSFEVLTLTLLEQILLGNPASFLKKALIDSGLGSALSDGSGYDADNRDTLFACGLKDVEESAAAEIEAIIFDVLKKLVEEGIDKKMIEAAIHQLEFHRKEITNHPYPYGLKLLLLFFGSWLHGGDPVRMLKFDSDLERLRLELDKAPFFEDRVHRYFLSNPHRVQFRLVPDQTMEAKENQRVGEELERIRSGMTPSDLRGLKEDAERLRRLQETTEDVSCLPTLELRDIPSSVQMIKEVDAYGSGAEATYYDQPTSGIFYFSAAAGTRALPGDLLPLVPFFCHAFSRIGTTQRDYTQIARMIDAYTGGIGLSAQARTRFEETGACTSFIVFNGKCLVRNLDKMFEIIEELICRFDFSDLARLRNLLLEYRARLESMVVHNGHRLAISLASRNFSAACALNEIWHGIHQLKTVKNMTRELTDEALQPISERLSSIGKCLFQRNNLKIALIGENPALAAASATVARIQTKLENGTPDGFQPPHIDLCDEVPREGWGTSTAVSFVARTFQTVRMEHEDAPALSVIGKILRSMYLHREIREKGGAYGGFSLYNLEDGIFCFGSYRDPHIVSTLNVYDNAVSFIRSGNYEEEDIKEAILQVCSEIDKPDPPGAAARMAFQRKIISLSDEARIRFKRQLLKLNRDRVRQVAEKHFNPDGKKHAVVVISGEDQLKEANKKMSPAPLTLYKI